MKYGYEMSIGKTKTIILGITISFNKNWLLALEKDDWQNWINKMWSKNLFSKLIKGNVISSYCENVCSKLTNIFYNKEGERESQKAEAAQKIWMYWKNYVCTSQNSPIKHQHIFLKKLVEHHQLIAQSYWCW